MSSHTVMLLDNEELNIYTFESIVLKHMLLISYLYILMFALCLRFVHVSVCNIYSIIPNIFSVCECQGLGAQ